MAAETLQYGISFRESVEPPSAHDTPPPGKNAAAISSGAETLPAPSQIDIGNTTVPHDAPSFPQPFSPSRISGHPSSLNSTRILKDARPLSIRPLGEARRKKHLNWLDIVSVAVAILCLVISIVAVSPQWPTIPWRLGLKRQLQVLGVMLSIMNQCLRVVAPKAFLITEAKFGKSYLQNYDAILRNSVFLSHTGFVWRAILLALIALPTGLSVAYKEFIEGSGSLDLRDTGGYYGMAGPGGLSSAGQHIGVSLMVNASLPFILASSNDSVPPLSTDRAYGFNTLLLSDNRTAFLDAPMPDYVSSIQSNLSAGETWTVEAMVTATIAKYNNTAERHRNDTAFWDYYINEQYSGTGSIFKADLYNQHEVDLLVNNFNDQNASWCFLALAYTDANVNRTAVFQATALQFNVRRDLCRGTWLISNDSIQLTNGACDEAPLDDSAQKMFTNTTLTFATYYLPILSEYLGPFAVSRNESQWLFPTLTTVVAGMYWSRMTGENGFYSWGPNPSVDVPPSNANHSKRSDVYYYVPDHIRSTRPTMHATWVLYFVLTVQPFLTLALFVAALSYYQAPLDSGFGMIAILAGARHETLKLLWGASMSGKTSEPVRMKIAVDDPVTTTGKNAPPEIEYIIGGEGENESLSHALRYRDPYFANKFHSMQNRLGRSGTQYEMLSRR